MSKLTREQLSSVAGLSSYEASTKLGVPASTIRDARRHPKFADLEKGVESSTHPAEEKFREDKKADNTGTVSVTVLEDLEPEDILRKFGRDPEKVKITGILSESHWGSDEKGWQHSYKFATEYITDEAYDLTIKDLPLLYSQVAVQPRDELPHSLSTVRGNVIIWADPQVGKVDSRGGTPELIARVHSKRAKLEAWLQAHPAETALFASVGDEVESFENVPSQQFMNDLSFPDQLDLELTFELDFIRTLAQSHAHLTVTGVTSNHCQWRKGKDVLGKPSDDYGLYLKRQLEKALRLNTFYDHVEFEYPEPWDETVAVNIAGTKLAFAHGHQVNNPNQIVDWWKKQAFGGQASADADVLVTGHFHHFRMEEVTANPKTNKSRVWIQAPTLDNGSSWVRNKWGNDSTPGLIVFQVTPEGIDLSSLTLL